MPESPKPLISEELVKSLDDITLTPRRTPAKQEIEPLATQINDYLVKYRKALADRVFGPQTDTFTEASSAHSMPVLRAAAAFEELTSSGLGSTKLLLPKEAGDIVEEINYETRLSPSGPQFTDIINRYYEELEALIEVVVDKVKFQGPAYLMQDVYVYNEEAAADIEAVLRKLTEARKISSEELDPRSQEYGDINASRPRGFVETMRGMKAVDPEAIEEVDRMRISRNLEATVQRFMDTDSDVERKKTLFLVTSDLLHHLSRNIGEKGLKFIGEPRKRPLGQLPDGPLQQLEAMMAIINTVIRDYENLVTLHRDLIGGIGSEQKRDRRRARAASGSVSTNDTDDRPLPLLRIKKT